jgi:hypothetical protein
MADSDDREQQLYNELAACPVVEVAGVVSPTGVGAAKMRGERRWSLLATFDAWRVGDGPLRMEPLTLRRKVSDQELARLQEAMPAETVVQVRARVAERNVFGSPQAHVEEFVGVDPPDPELHAFLAEIQKPIIRDDDFFGTLTFDRSVSWYAGKARWNGVPVELNLAVDEPEDFDAVLKVAHALWGDENAWSERVRTYAAQELLPLKNESWRNEDEAEVSPAQFLERMTLESITVYPDGSFEFLHDDGDLFWGHAIQVIGSLSEGLTDADIPG